MRLPHQAGPVDLRNNFYMPASPCLGKPFHGSQDLPQLVYRPLHSQPFCASPGWTIGQGIVL